MPTYEVEVGGTVYEVEADDPSQLDAFAQEISGPPEIEYSQASPDEPVRTNVGFGEYLTGLGESALEGVSGVAAMVPAGYAGLFGLLRGPENAAENVSNVMGKITYKPKTAVAESVGEAQGMLAAPIIAATEGLGSAAYEATGSPLAGALAETVPAAIASTTAGVTGARALRRRREAQAPPTTDELFAEASAAGREMTEAGVRLKPSASEKLAKKVDELSTDKEITLDKKLTPATQRVVKGIRDDIRSGEISTFDDAYRMKRRADTAMTDAFTGNRTSDYNAARSLRNKIDEFLDDLDADDAFGGDTPAAQEAMTRMRRNTHAGYKSQVIDEVIDRATTNAEGASRADFTKSLITEFRNLAKNKKKMARFTPEEQALIRNAARGGSGAGVTGTLASFSPLRSESHLRLMIMQALGGWPVAGGAAGVGLAGDIALRKSAASAARKASEGVRRGALDLRDR